MEDNKKKAEAQGAEKAEKRTQAKSVTYALKAIGEHLRTLKAAELISNEDALTVGTILEGAGSKYIKNMWK